MPDDLGTDLHQFLPQRGQRPVFHRLGQGKRSQEVAQVVGQRMKLEPDLVVAEAMTGQSGPVDRVLALLDVLLRRAALIVESHHAFGGAAQVGDDKAW